MTNQQPSKPIQEGLKLIARYTPMIGSALALGSFIINSEWGKAIITIPPTILTTIWVTAHRNKKALLKSITSNIN